MSKEQTPTLQDLKEIVPHGSGWQLVSLSPCGNDAMGGDLRRVAIFGADSAERFTTVRCGRSRR